jgi:serine/threonine protein kinase
MAESQSKSRGDNEGTAQPTPSLESAAADVRAAPGDCSFLGDGSVSDEAPTIVSSATQTPVGKDDALAAVLRGKRLAQFELLEPVGVGGMAAVVRARDIQLDRTVALKILPPGTASDPELVRRFHQEARAAARLDHENIARVFFCGEDQGLHFIAFEFVEGENLLARLERQGTITVREAISFLIQVTEGLIHAADRGVVHRDIKPSNIIITPGGKAKLVDMGLARTLEKHRDDAMTQPGATLGTYDYISPEQALEPHDADSRSDIYSLGCTFYHVLTGQPPVPDGTAAKKLHYHERIDPIDPRQLNPDIPDELTFILGRMMAKKPADRYQEPRQLLVHLLSLAPKSGVQADDAKTSFPAGVPLPGPPRGSPLVTGLAAGVALIALVLLLGPGQWPRSPNRATPPSEESAAAITERNAAVANVPRTSRARENDDSPAAPPTSGVSDLKSGDLKEIAGFIEGSSSARVVLTADLNLDADHLLAFDGTDLTIEPDNPSIRATIRLQYSPAPLRESWAALTIRRGTVRIKNIRFVVDTTGAPDISMTAIEQQGGRVELQNCEFVQQHARVLDQGRLSSVRVSAAPVQEEADSLVASGCYFAGGKDAFRLAGPAMVKAVHCAFAPHSGALFALQEPVARNGSITLDLQNCSAMLNGESVFQLSEHASCSLQVDDSLFSRVGNGPATLVEQMGSYPAGWRYRGHGNRYHDLKSFWKRTTAGQIQDTVSDLSLFCQRFGSDDESGELSTSPWEHADPTRFLQSDPRLAFRLDTNVTRLRAGAVHMVGVEHCVWGDSYAETLQPLVESPAATSTVAQKRPLEAVIRAGEKIVDPTIEFPKENVYRTLRQALEDAKPGDGVLIKHNRQLAVDPVRLDRAGLDVTIRPYPSYQPLLTLGAATESDAALFRLFEGHLRLEKLEFLVSPGRSEFKSQTIVAIMGDGRCTFKDCTVTLESREVPLSVVTVADPSSVMKLEPPPPQPQDGRPRVHIGGCFVRGNGNLVVARPSRAFDFNIEESLIALDGSLVVVDGNSGESFAKDHADITLREVTTYLTDHLVYVRAGKESLKGLAPTLVQSATDCLFASAVGKSLVHLDGVDTDEQMKQFFSWRDSRHNAYSNFGPMLDQQPRAEGDMMAPPAYGKVQWEDFAQESNGRFERVKFTAPPAPAAPLSRVAATDFRTKPEADMLGYGADIDKIIERIPRSADTESSGGAER